MRAGRQRPEWGLAVTAEGIPSGNKETLMGTPDSREYDRLKERQFQPYSKGHRQMYELGIADLKARGFGRIHDEITGAKVLEAGFGIGWGLGRMVEEGVIRQYAGYEPNFASYTYTTGLFGDGLPLGASAVETGTERIPVGNILLFNEPFAVKLEPDFDAAFCIEVIEHVPMDKHADFVRDLFRMAPVLYFSTPDIRKAPTEGVRTKEEWTDILFAAGARTVFKDDSNWTTFYRAVR